MNKRGSHVGMIISFMIFVTFLLLIHYLIEPAVSTEETKEDFMNNVEYEVMNDVSSEMLITTISVSGVTASCISINSFISEFDAYDGIVVKDENENVVTSTLSSDADTLQIQRGSSSIDFFKIYSSEGFSSASTATISCTQLAEDITYFVEATKRGDYIFEEKVSSLIDDYSNYENFKKNLNLPNNTEVGIEFELENGLVINTTEKTVTTNIYIKESSVEYVDEDANVLSGKLRVKMW